MLTWLVRTSLQRRVVVLALWVLLLLYGGRMLRQAPLDVFPEFAPPYVEIQTEAPGLSTEEVESLITVPLESALNGTIGVKTIRSKSVLGLSSVVLIFSPNTELIAARQLVQERLNSAAARLPTVARTPVMLQPLSSTSRLLKIGVWSDQLSQSDLTVLALWTVRPRLMSIPGVANVAIWGQRDRQFQVIVDPQHLRAVGVTLDSVIQAARDATSVETGGFVDTPNQRLAVQHRSAIREPEDLAEMVVDYRLGAPLRLGDVAEVTIGSPPAIGDAVVNDRVGLLLIVEKQPQANTLEVTRAVDAALVQLTPALKDVQLDATIFRPATFIERALNNLGRAMLLGCVLVSVILVMFLANWRAALVSLTAIPLSLVAAAAVLIALGQSINTLVLAGLVIALGEVVDDAIIDVENIVRRLRTQRDAGESVSALDVVLAASLEVRSSVVYASLIVTLVFVPVFFLEGLAGAFFRPLALAYVLAIAASLLVALTATPALSLWLLPGAAASHSEGALSRVSRRVYAGCLRPLIERPGTCLGLLSVMFLAAALATTQLGQEFLPNFQETDFLMHFVEKPGTSLEAMRRITLRASRDLRAVPGVRNFGAHLGRAEIADEVVGPNFTELWISVDPEVDYAETLARVETTVAGYPGLYRDVQTYLKERIKEVLTGAQASIVVRIFGPDLETLRTKAREIEAALADVPGVAQLKVEPQVLIPQVVVQLRPDAAARFGLTAGHLRRVTTAMLHGTRVGQVFEDQKQFDVVVWGIPSVRTDLEALRSLPVDTPSGMQARLGDVAEVTIAPAPNEIKRERASRRLDVTCNVSGRDLGSVARDVEQRVAAIAFPREYHAEVLGEYAERQASSRRLFGLTALSLAAIVLVLYVDFQSWRLTLLVVLTLPFALVGGVAAVFLTGGILSLGSLVGFVTVLGIAARNGIMLLSHFRHLEQSEGEPFGRSLVLRGAAERLAPILMTALATGLALVPIVVGGVRPGHEIEHPLAVVILGGLTTSTLLNLFLLPPLYLRLGRGAAQPSD